MHLAHQHILSHQNSDQYHQCIDEASQLIKNWLDSQSLYQGGAPTQVAKAIELSVTAEGMGLDKLLSQIESAYLPHCISTAHPACLAHLHPPSLLVGQLAELFISATNQSMDSWNQSPIATSMEQQLIAWLCQQCALAEGSGVFTSGGTQSNMMGLLLARNHFYRVKGYDVQLKGLPAKPQGKILCSDQAHFSVEKNASLLGLGRESVIKIGTDDNGAMCPAELARVIRCQGRGNILAVVATAGTTDTGAIDPLKQIATLCHQSDHPNLWLHVDAAWGGALLLSQQYRHLIDGLQQADSITLDFHKHWFLPISCGAFLLKDTHQYDSIRHHSDYLNPLEDEDDDIPNLVRYSLQTTRRFDALKLWMSLAALGTKAYGQLIDICIDIAQQVAKYLEELEDFVLLNDPATNGISSVIFIFEPTRYQLEERQRIALNRHIAKQLLLRSIANVATSQFKGRFCLKFTILNPNTQMIDIQSIIEEIRLIGDRYYQEVKSPNPMTPC